jgi:hypothetical protein
MSAAFATRVPFSEISLEVHLPRTMKDGGGAMSAHGGRRSNQALGSVLEEAEHNLLAAFKKSQKTKHRALAGNARAKNIADFLSARLPSVYGVATNGEIVDYTDRRSGEIDIVIYDRQRNAVVSAEPLWVAAETLLAYIEVKTTLTQTELEKAFEAQSESMRFDPSGEHSPWLVTLTHRLGTMSSCAASGRSLPSVPIWERPIGWKKSGYE